MKIASLPQAKLNISVQRNGQPYISGNEKIHLVKNLKKLPKKIMTPPPDRSNQVLMR
ncbi:hypothetical protein ACHHV8_26745 [Paenibacillus sp. TAB 01]|uniref:hypothetical protein n=1 Tax=Paenibacillus sp. TAB 01 TaxID=3368988 RepID=UPI0037526F4E